MQSRHGSSRIPTRLPRRRFLAISGAGGLAAFLAACGGGDDAAPSSSSAPGVTGTTAGLSTAGVQNTADQPKTGGTLRMAADAEIVGGLNPHTGTGGTEHQYFFPLFDPLIGYNQKGQLDPAISLAEKWELAEPTRVVLKIRPGVKFHDGTDLTAEAVKWNLDFIIDPANSATPRSDLAAIESVQATGPLDIAIRLKQPSAPLLTNLGDRGGQMVSPTAFQKIGRDPFKRAPVGTGPFVFKEWIVDASKTYERNPNYWRKDAQGRTLPYLQTIRLELIPDATVRSAALESGQIDLLPTPAATDVNRLLANSNFQSTRFIGASTGIWSVNISNAPMDNVNMRRAFAASLDRASYVKNFLTGAEPLAGGLLTPASWAYDPSVTGYPYDVNKAKEYLQQSGLPPERWRVVSNPGASFNESHQFFETNLKAAGITIDWQNPDPQVLNNKVLKGLGADGSVTVYFVGWSMRVDPDGNLGQWYLQRASYNPGQSPVPDLEPLVIKAREIYDEAERKKLYSEIQRIAVDQVVNCVPLWYTTATAFGAKKVGNLTNYFGGEGKPRYANLWV